MNRALLAKELRALLPLATCILALFAVGMLYTLATEAVDAQQLQPATWLVKSRSGSLFFLALFSALLGAGLLVHESDQRTLLFLDGLPLSRTRIFFVKVLAAVLVISLVPLVDAGSDILFGWLVRTSIDPPFPGRFLAVETSLQILAGAYLVALAMLLSFTRAWFALVTGLLVWLYLWARQHGQNWLAYFDSYELLEPTLLGSRVLVSWRHVAAHAGATVGCLAAAWLAFLSLGDRAQFAADRFGRLRWLVPLGTGLRWLAPVVWIAVLARLASTSGNTNSTDHSPVGEKSFFQYETKRYDFLLRTAQWGTAKPLIYEADGICDKVAAFLGAPPAPERVVVDLASSVMSHAAGQTNWTKIRMPLRKGTPLAEARLILGHETTHVFIEQLSDGRLGAHFNEVRCFHEGLATHVELSLFGTDADRARNRRAVAAAWSRGRVPLELLTDDNALGKKREPFLVYPLGEVFASSLIAMEGKDAPVRLLHAFARKDAPSGLRGMALWRDTMQAAGLNLDRVAAAYETACARAEEQEQRFVATLPHLAATVHIVKGNIVVQPFFLGFPPGRIVCVTQTDDPLVTQFEYLTRQNNGSFTWPRQRQSKPVFRYLLGWSTTKTRSTVFEPWAEAVPEKDSGQ